MAADPLKPAPVRAFLAIPLHDIFRPEIETLLRALARDIPEVRWVEPRQFHLTLHFYGPVAAQEIGLIDASSKKVAALFPPLEFTVGTFGAFPHLQRPDLLWLGIEEKTGGLVSLQKAIQGEARTLGFRAETRSFLPHATIGRVKRKNAVMKSLSAQSLREFEGLARTSDRFALYQSHCRPEGAHYEILKTYPFSKKAKA